MCTSQIPKLGSRDHQLWVAKYFEFTMNVSFESVIMYYSFYKPLSQGCATFFVSGPYNQLQTSSWATRKI